MDHYPRSCARMRAQQPANALTRRAALTSAGVLAAMPLIGCSQQRSRDSTEGRTVAADNGQIVVPPEPKRVVVTDIYLVSTLYDLGVRPVGIPTGLLGAGVLPPEVDAWLADDVTEIGTAGEINRDRVLGLDPDLVIDQFYPDATAPLSELAPVVFFDWRASGRSWRDQQAKVADALDRSAQLEDHAQRYTDRLRKLTTTYPAAWKLTWAVAAGAANGDWVLGSVVVELLTELGAQTLDKMTTGYDSYSRELLGMLEAADVICYPVLFDQTPPTPTAELIDSDQFRSLPAAEAGRTYPISYSGVSCYFHAFHALDELEAIAADLSG